MICVRYPYSNIYFTYLVDGALCTREQGCERWKRFQVRRLDTSGVLRRRSLACHGSISTRGVLCVNSVPVIGIWRRAWRGGIPFLDSKQVSDKKVRPFLQSCGGGECVISRPQASSISQLYSRHSMSACGGDHGQSKTNVGCLPQQVSMRV